MDIERKIEELGYTLPPVPASLGAYIPAVRVGNLLFVGGKIPWVEGKLKYEGKLGKDLTIEQGREGARVCALSLLAVVRQELGDLDKIKRIVRLVGYINSAQGFTEQAKVLDGASEFFLEVFGDKGKHARLAIGTSELPQNAPVEMEIIVQV